MGSRVGHVVLTLDVPAGRAAPVREGVERRFVQAALDGLEAAAHRTLGPDAVLCVRHLRVAWSVSEDELSDAHAATLGEELADALILRCPPPHTPALPDPEGEVALFEDEAHRRAVLLVERALGRVGWYHGPSPTPTPVADQAQRGREAVVAMMRHLVRLDRVQDGIRGAEPGAWRALADGVPASSWPEPVLLAAVAASEPSREAAPHVPIARSEPAVPPSAQPRAEAPAVPHPRAAARAPAPDERRPDGPAAPASESASPAVGTPAAAPASADPPAVPPRSLDPAPDEAPAPGAPGRPAPARRRPPFPAVPGVFEAIPTRWGGLFYLVHRVKELELGQHLWCAMVREGEVLACATRLLIDDRGDPAPALFGGVDEVPHQPDVRPEAFDEVFDETVTTLRACLVHRLGRAPDDLADRLLAEAAVLCTAEDPASRLVALAAVAPVHLFLARLRVPTADPRTIRPYLRIPGRVVLPPEALMAVLPMSAIDVNVRIAGLDMDPGWTPWLGRQVSVVFEVDEEGQLR